MIFLYGRNITDPKKVFTTLSILIPPTAQGDSTIFKLLNLMWVREYSDVEKNYCSIFKIAKQFFLPPFKRPKSHMSLGISEKKYVW